MLIYHFAKKVLHARNMQKWKQISRIIDTYLLTVQGLQFQLAAGDEYFALNVPQVILLRGTSNHTVVLVDGTFEEDNFCQRSTNILTYTAILQMQHQNNCHSNF